MVDGERILKSPTLFAIEILGVKPFPYQVEFLEDESDRIIVVGGRQSGKSTMIALKSLWIAFVKPKQDILIIAPTLRQARIVFDKIKELMSKSVFVIKHVKKNTMSEIRFDNNSVIRIVPAGNSGDVARGFSCDLVIFDECAFISDDVIISIEPSVSAKGGKIIYSGTPYGTRGRFYELWREKETRKGRKKKGSLKWSYYHFPSRLNPLISEEFLEEMKKLMTENQFLQEYEGQFISEVGLLYPLDLILSCLEDYDYWKTRKEDGRYVIGVDPSRMGEDETAIVILKKWFDEEDNDYYKLVYVETLSKSTSVEIAKRIIKLIYEWRPEKIYIDTTGVGGGVEDVLRSEYPDYNDLIEGVVFTYQEKIDMHYRLKTLMENKRIVFPRGDRKLLNQFLNFNVDVTADGRLRIIKGDGRDDIVDAIILAVRGGGLKFEFLDELAKYFSGGDKYDVGI